MLQFNYPKNYLEFPFLNILANQIQPSEDEAPIEVSNADDETDQSIVEITNVSSFTVNETVLDNSVEEIPSPPKTSNTSGFATIAEISPVELSRLQQELQQKQLLIQSCRLESLPDGGAKLKQQIQELEEKLTSAKYAPSQQGKAKQVINGEAQEDGLRKQLQMKKVASF